MYHTHDFVKKCLVGKKLREAEAGLAPAAATALII